MITVLLYNKTVFKRPCYQWIIFVKNRVGVNLEGMFGTRSKIRPKKIENKF